MRRVIQRTITTTKIISLNITHSESEEAIEYTVTGGPDQLDTPAAPDDLAPDDHTATAQTDNPPALDGVPVDHPPA